MLKRIGVKAVAIGSLLVAGAGYLTGILTAPKSGKETRKDIAKSASSARTSGEKQLKKLHSELTDLIDQADKKTKSARSKVSLEVGEAADKAKKAREKAKNLLSALHNGDADDRHLQAAIEEIKLAKKNLGKYLKK